MHRLFKKAHLILALGALLVGDIARAADDVGLPVFAHTVRQRILEKYNLLPRAMRENMEHYGTHGCVELKACHEEVSGHALSVVMGSWTWCKASENNERAYMGSAIFCALVLGGNVIPSFVESVLCCGGMLSVCALSAYEFPSHVEGRWVKYLTPSPVPVSMGDTSEKLGINKKTD